MRFSRLLEQSTRRPSLSWIDAVVVAVVAVVAISSIFSEDVTAGMKQPGALSVVMAIAAASTLAFRRRYPVGSLVAVATFVSIPVALGFPEGILPIIFYFLVSSMAARTPLNRALAGFGFSVAVIAALTVLAPNFGLGVATVSLLLVTLAWIVGAGIRWRLDSAQAETREAQQRAETERLRGARAVTEERLRIAQDLHDVVAHSMSVIAVQAGMGSHVLDTDPDKARAALLSISDISRSTLTEMRGLLSILRSDDGERTRAPAPGIGDLSSLVGEVQNAGLPVTLEIAGQPTRDIPGLELTAYRVVQEALTNVIKHAGSTSEVLVRLHFETSELVIDVSDDGRGLASRPSESGAAIDRDSHVGHGLMGMRERVEVWGGRASAGPRDGGGYLVHVSLPLGDPQ